MKQKEFDNYANSFQAIARLRLESIDRLLFHLGNPQKQLKFIHIAGTNGKGSVSAFLQSILTSAGYRTGKYISPNMISVCERISIDNAEISENDLKRFLGKVKNAADIVNGEFNEYPTQFEIWTAAAFLYFLEKECDFVVLETGLGGTRDATNIIPPPAVSVITHIAMDHMAYLGNTLGEIAFEKSGIIKAHASGKGCTVSAIQAPEAYEVLERVCQERSNILITAEKPESISGDENGEYFNYKGIKNLHTNMLGIHQLDNAAVAIETAKYLGISETDIKTGIEKAKNIGRFEIVSKNPLIVFDGAHNPDGMKTLVNALNRYFPKKTKSFIMATMQDKDISGSLEELKNALNQTTVYTVSVSDNPRSMSAEKLCETVSNAGLNAVPCKDITEALSNCKDDMTVICGSLYLYKDFTEAFFKDQNS